MSGGAGDRTSGGAMTPERWDRITEILGEALDRPAGERPAFVARMCGEDVALRQEVESLLAASGEDGEAGAFLAAPLLDLRDAARAAAVEPAAVVGQRIGRYRVLAPLGAGWMGEVYLAEDP